MGFNDNEHRWMQPKTLEAGCVIQVIAVNLFWDAVELWDRAMEHGLLALHKANGLTRGDLRRLARALGIPLKGMP